MTKWVHINSVIFLLLISLLIGALMPTGVTVAILVLGIIWFFVMKDRDNNRQA